jgi:hypothetical protein
LVTSLVLDIRLLGSLLLGYSDLWLLGSLLLGCSDLWLLRNLGSHRPRSGHLLLTPVVQSLKKGLLSKSGGRTKCPTNKNNDKIYQMESNKVIMNDDICK